jgi:uncharacterized membrane protein
MPEADNHSHTGRIEAFSDGVFAIAITLLIIEIGVPDVHGGGDLNRKLLDLWPDYLAYILSFFTIGVYWANHHTLFRLFHATDHIFLMLNVLFLMTIAFVPFPTAVLGEYLKDPEHRAAAMHLFAIGLLLPATGWFILWTYGRWRGLLDPYLDPGYLNQMTWQYALSQAPYWTALGVSFINPWVSWGIVLGVAAFYLLPPRRPQYLPSWKPAPPAAD